MSGFKSRNDMYESKTYNQFKSYNNTTIVIPKKDFEIKVNDFPELTKSVTKPITNKSSNNVKSFTSLLKKKEEVKEEVKAEVKEEEIVPPGWVLYKHTKNNNKLFGIKYSKITSIQSDIDKKTELINVNDEDNDDNVAQKIVITLSKLYEKHTNEYKELWGEDEWERMFICPNYDSEYFDKLDEAYQNELDKLYEDQHFIYNDNFDYDDYDYYN